MNILCFQKRATKLTYVFLLICLFAVSLQPIEIVSAQTVATLSFQADIYGTTNLETIEYPSTLAFTYWGGAGTTAHTYRSRIAGGDQVAFAIARNIPLAFSMDVINQSGDQITLSLASVDYPTGFVESISPNELHFSWNIDQSGLHVRLHRYVRLFSTGLVTVEHVIEEKYEIENLGPRFTLTRFSEYLRMDDSTGTRDYNNDTKPETLLAINNFSTHGYPVFGKVYLPQSDIQTQFSISGNSATVMQDVPSLRADTGIKLMVTRANYVSSAARTATLAESEVANDAATLLGMDNSLPTSIDLSSQMPPVGNQGNQGSCVGWAIAYYYKSYQEHRQRGWAYSDETLFSPAYIYNQLATSNNGLSSMDPAMQLVVDQGIAPLASFPYNDQDWHTQPSPRARSEATAFKAAGYQKIERVSVSDLETLRSHLAGGDVFVLVIPLYTYGLQFLDWNSGIPAHTPPVIDDPSGPSWYEYPGGHAITIVGYDDSQLRFKFINSWGEDWGEEGYGYVTYRFVLEVVGGTSAYMMTDMPSHTLSVSKTGTGNGRVISSLTGIDCGSDCSELYDAGLTVTLNTLPGAGSVFTGWAGACTGTNPCVVPITGDTSVTANFASANTSGLWYIYGTDVALFGARGDKPVVADYNGDGKADIAVYRPSNGTWYVRGLGNFIYGGSNDIPLPADYDGDGDDDIAVFRPSNSTWYIRGIGQAVYGAAGDIPVVADYNGDGKADIAVFRPSNSTWYIRGIGPAVYGTVGDIPVVADYNGDGKADIAVFRPSNSTWYVRGIGPSLYGTAGDIPVVADYNGDGRANIAVYRPSNNTWYIRGIGPFIHGATGDIPVVGDYNGDGRADIAVYRP